MEPVNRDAILLSQLTNQGATPTVIMGDPMTQTASQEPMTADEINRVSMMQATEMNPRSGKSYGRRMPMDMSMVPKDPKPENLKDSIQAETFKPGGEFDQMMERKKKEMEETMNDPKFQQQAKSAMQSYAKSRGEAIDFDEDGTAIPGEKISKPNSVYSVEDDEDFYDEDDTENLTQVSKESIVDFDDFEDEPDVPVNIPAGSVTAENVYAAENPAEDVKSLPLEEESADTVEDVEFEDSSSVEEEHEIEEPEPEVNPEDLKAEEEAKLALMKQDILAKLRPVSQRMNVEGFAVVKRGEKGAKNKVVRTLHVAKWPLVNTGIIAEFKEIAGSMLELMRTYIMNNDVRAVLHMIYDNITSSKPQNFIAWANSVDAGDYEHLFMGYYIACFKGSNYIPVDCANKECKRGIFITDDIPFAKMVKFKNAEAKRRFNKIYKEEPVNSDGARVSYRVAISSQIAVDLSRPSLYKEYVEISYLSEAFIRKYADVLEAIKYIDELYTIDAENGTLTPIEYEIVKDNPGKSTINKVKAYATYIRTLTVDENAILLSHMDELKNKKEIGITYQRPELICPHCGTVKPAEEMSAGGLVFTRNRLALMATI